FRNAAAGEGQDGDRAQQNRAGDRGNDDRRKLPALAGGCRTLRYCPTPRLICQREMASPIDRGSRNGARNPQCSARHPMAWPQVFGVRTDTRINQRELYGLVMRKRYLGEFELLVLLAILRLGEKAY